MVLLCFSGTLHWRQSRLAYGAEPGRRWVKAVIFSLGVLGLFVYAWYRRDLLLGLGLVFFLVLILGKKL